MRIGTRGSALALAQARWVADRLADARFTNSIEIVQVTTLGDRGAAGEGGPAARDKARWVTELERALREDRIDIAVHSAKDVPARLDPELPLVAVPARAAAHDVLCGASGLSALAHGATVGTASIRRHAQLHALRPDLNVVTLRGNVDTRLRKLADGEADALVLAAAGLERLGRGSEAGGVLDRLVPAAGQGALAIQSRPGTLSAAQLAAVTDAEAMACVAAERALVAALGAGCDTPVGAWCRMRGDGLAELTAWVGTPDGGVWLRDELAGSAPDLGARVAERMLAAGARDVLDAAERQAAELAAA